MSKGGLALSSLVMAIPAGLLAYLSIRSVFERNESMPMLVTIIVWTLIVLSVLLAISPIIFLIAGPKGAKAVPATAAGDADMDVEPVGQSRQKPTPKKSEDDEFAEDEGVEQDEQLFDTSDDEAGADEFEDNFNFDEEEEEPAPKKKKK